MFSKADIYQYLNADIYQYSGSCFKTIEIKRWFLFKKLFCLITI